MQNKDEEVKNAKQLPAVFYARHLEAGHATYENETILLDNPILVKMAPTFIGKPVYAENHQKVDMENLQEQADGYVVESFYNVDGWLWVKFIAVSDAAHEAIAKGWGVSNAYIPTDFTGSGTHHNTPYDRKIIDGHFTHLAIVEFPRYEESKILTPEEFKSYQEATKAKLEELQNSKPKPRKENMFSIFKTKKEEVTQISPDAMLELENGESVSIQEMVNAVKKNEAEDKKDDEEEKSEKVNMDTEIDVDGEKMPLKELVSKYKNAMKKNSDDKDADDKKDDEAKNADSDKSDDDKSKDEDKKDDEKNNSKYFDELQNAHKLTSVRVYETSSDKIARGMKLYGSAN